MLWDVFISHASEDKNEVARPLAESLQRSGLRVWLDEAQLRLGDSLRAKIDEGLAESQFGVVVLSPAFFAKDWPQRELGALFTRPNAILPVWHQLHARDVAAKSPLVADLIAASTADGLDAVAARILQAVGRPAVRTYQSELAVSPQRIARALQVLEHLTRSTTWPHLAIRAAGYPLTGWMGSNSTTLVETLYAFAAPVVEYRQLAYAVRRNFALLGKESRLLFGLMESAAEAICADLVIAAIEPSIDYTPRVDGWRSKRIQNPQRYWWQGISEDRLRDAIPFFLRSSPATTDDPLVSADEFHDTYQRIYSSGDVKLKEGLGLLANGFYGFTPATRPVLWRLCVVLSLLYSAALGNTLFDVKKSDAGDDLYKLFQPEDSTRFPFTCRSAGPLYEEYGTTLHAARQYLETTCVPRIRAYLKASREEM